MYQQSPIRELILASSSRYRKQLLLRLGLPFITEAPDLDETRQNGESPGAMTQRLAGEKSELIAARYPNAVVIGSDQVAVCKGIILGKPGHAENAVQQLLGFSGQYVEFLTAVSVNCIDSSFFSATLVTTTARFRHLDVEEIRRYVSMDQPYDCAGGFKAESAGVTLLRSLDSEDPTAIIGLPLIRLSSLLRDAGYSLP